jgi:HK97 family phage major capsid protein
MSEKIIEKLDLIEAESMAKIEEVKAEAVAAVEAVKAEMTEQVVALEAKISAIQAPEVMRPAAKTIKQDVNRKVKEQLAKFVKKGSMSKEFEIFADESEYNAYLTETGSQIGNPAGYGGGYNVGGRTAYDPVFHKMRLVNPLRGVSRNVTTDGSVYQFRAKTGNAGAQFGYQIQNNGAPTTENTSIWQTVLQDMNCQFPIRTAALDDIDGLESNVVDDMLLEFSQLEGLAMIQNNNQSSPTGNPTGGSNGIIGLNQYGGANVSYAGGTTSTAAFGSSGTASTDGLHSIATYDQLTTNGYATSGAGANNVTFDDIITFLHSLPQEYWTPDAKIIVNPFFLAQIRGLKDSNGTPIFDRMTPLITDGIVGQIAGFDVVVNKYVDTPYQTASNTTNESLYPMYFGQWSRFHTIVDRLNMVLRRYDQTLPGFITFFGEKRLATSVVDPFSAIRYRSTATALDA